MFLVLIQGLWISRVDLLTMPWLYTSISAVQVLLSAELQMLDSANKHDSWAGALFQVVGGHFSAFCMPGKGKLDKLRLSLCGPLSLRPSKHSYLAGSIGNLEAWVNGSDVLWPSEDSYEFPAFAWALPASSDEEEVTLTMHKESLKINTAFGPVPHAFEVCMWYLKLKKDVLTSTEQVPLVRPLLEKEVAGQVGKKKAAPPKLVVRGLQERLCASVLEHAGGLDANAKPAQPAPAAPKKRARGSRGDEKLTAEKFCSFTFLVGRSSDSLDSGCTVVVTF